MTRIDGAKIKQLREQKKLTQLYLSTVVGVTTDTISRWENKRYQSIKLENAEKLAQALEVSLEEILQEDGETAQPEPSVPAPSDEEVLPVTTPAKRLYIIIPGIFLIVMLIGILFYSSLPNKTPALVSAERVLPPHVPPGKSFPVLIRVRAANSLPVSLIIKETIPPGTTASHGLPPFTSLDSGDNSLRWVNRTDQPLSVYAFMCVLSPEAETGEKLLFSGTVTLKQDISDEQPIRGPELIEVAPFHWADANRDSIIDDEEILAVYDMYSDIEELPFDRERIDSLWASSRYRWDADSGQYIGID